MCTGLDIQTTSRSLTVQKGEVLGRFLAVLSEILKYGEHNTRTRKIHGKCNRRVTSRVRIDHPIKVAVPYLVRTILRI